MKTDLVTITANLDQQKLKYHILQSEQTAVLILPEYGRILGIWSNIRENNHFWTNQDFLKGQQPSADWANPGGHRIWLAPEREFFIHDLSRPFETYQVPSAVDPGNYKCTCDCLSAELCTSGRLRAFAAQADCDFKITRTIGLLSDSEILKLTNHTQIQAAGYRDFVELRVDKGCSAGVWSLLQVPLRGTISMPVSRSGGHKIFFGKEVNLVNYGNGLMNLSLAPDSRQEFKIGFKASDCGGVITCLHVYPDESATLIVKTVGVAHESDYVDTPWDEPDDKGYAVQFFCGGAHGFGELETHGPVYKNMEGGCESKLTIFVYAFAGQRDLIHQIQNNILNCSKHEIAS